MPLPSPAQGLRGAARIKSQDPLRESYFELFRRSYRRAEKQNKGSGLAVYRASAPMIHALCGEPWAKSTIFPTETALARRFLAETNLPASNPEAFVQHALMANAWASTWTGMLLKLGARGFAACCRVRGAEHLQKARADGRGAIMAHSHTAFTQLFWRWLEHEKMDPGVTLWQWTWKYERSQLNDPKLRAIEGARELHAALSALKRGGMVQVLADGGWGEEKFVRPFYNRRRPFQPSFAELALNTGATVLTVDSSLAADGRIEIDIGPPLGDNLTGGDRNQQLQELIERYVQHLDRRWQDHAASLEWYQMSRHLKYPSLRPSVVGATGTSGVQDSPAGGST